MTQYVGVIRKDMSAFMTPQGVQLQQNLDAKKIPEMDAHDFGLVGLDRQQRYFDSDKYEPATESGGVLLYDAENNPTSRMPETMAMRQAYDKASKRGVTGQKIGQGIGGAIGVLSGLVSLANAGAAGQDALTGAGQAFQTGEYMRNYASPKLGNQIGVMGAATAAPVKVERQKTFDEAPMVASPTNTPAPTPTPTPAPVAVAPPRNLPSDPRQIFNTNYAGVKNIRQQANELIGVNPYAQEGDYSAVNTSQENPFNPMMMRQPPDTASSPMTPMGTFQVTDSQGRPVHPPALTPPAEPTVAPPTTQQQDPGTVIGNELGTIQQQTLPTPDPTEGPKDAMKTIQSSEETGKTISDALNNVEKAEILGRQAAYDDFVKMFVEVKS